MALFDWERDKLVYMGVGSFIAGMLTLLLLGISAELDSPQVEAQE